MFCRVMIFVAIGSNLPHPDVGPSQAVCEAALAAIEDGPCRILQRSRWYRSAAVPKSDQPDYINGVISMETDMAPGELLVFLHRIEARFDRERSVINAARTLDLDLLTFEDIVNKGPVSPILPHPRMTERAFVLLPLAEIVPDWVHPVTGAAISALIAGLPDDQYCIPVDAKERPQSV